MGKYPFMCAKKGRVDVRAPGFSLIELLVVIGCIAILAALLVPGMRLMRESSNMAKSLANLRQLGAAMHLFISDNNGFLPRADGTDSDPGQDWSQALRPYGASLRLPEPRFEQNLLLINPAGVSPEYPASSVKTSYSMNGNLQIQPPPVPGESFARVFPITMVAVQKPSQTVLFGDMLYAGRAMNFSHLAYRCMNNTRATVLFVDGHCEARAKDTLSYEANFANPPLQ